MKKYSDKDMIDFIEREDATIGFYPSPKKRGGKWVVCTSTSESHRKTLREAIMESMQDHEV